MTVLQADLTWTGDRFERDVAVRIDAGRIVLVGPTQETPDVLLDKRALLPGFVNAHSHAFQRGLRGAGETFPEGAGSFWTWREAMYDLVARLDTDTLRKLCEQAFAEMRAAGITCVGEFHYLHHAGSGEDEEYAFDEVVLDAARAANVRIVLLNTYYNTGGIGKPLTGAQVRFRSASPDAFWRQMDRLVPLCEGEMRQLGVAVHSVRAASRGDLAEVAAEARRRGLVAHMHLEEQRLEIDDCRARYGQTPMEVFLHEVEVGESFTLVHCTHTQPDEMERYRAAGGNVCICPLTEANLGDGIAAVDRIGDVCLGTDSNARISMLEEMRWLEYVQRLRLERRGVVRDEEGRVAARLLDAATLHGARALGVPAGRIAPGCWADFVALDLEAPSLAGWTDETLLEQLVCGAGEEAIAATCVAGDWATA